MTSEDLPFTRTVRPIDRRVGVEALVPQLVRQDDHRRRALDRVAREDGAPELGRDAGYVENVAVGEGAVVALRLAVAGEVGRADVDAAEGLELAARGSRGPSAKSRGSIELS